MDVDAIPVGLEESPAGVSAPGVAAGFVVLQADNKSAIKIK